MMKPGLYNVVRVINSLGIVDAQHSQQANVVERFYLYNFVKDHHYIPLSVRVLDLGEAVVDENQRAITEPFLNE